MLSLMGGCVGGTAIARFRRGTDFKIDWQPEQRDGKPVVSGRFESKYGAAVSHIQLLVEGLDEKGEVINQTVAWLGGDILPFGRAYFEVPVQKFPHHRLSVFEPPPSIGRDAETLSGVVTGLSSSLDRRGHPGIS